jgi:hypothetical protein
MVQKSCRNPCRGVSDLEKHNKTGVERAFKWLSLPVLGVLLCVTLASYFIGPKTRHNTIEVNYLILKQLERVKPLFYGCFIYSSLHRRMCQTF